MGDEGKGNCRKREDGDGVGDCAGGILTVLVSMCQ